MELVEADTDELRSHWSVGRPLPGEAEEFADLPADGLDLEVLSAAPVDRCGLSVHALDERRDRHDWPNPGLPRAPDFIGETALCHAMHRERKLRL